jgi:hypothetical protein
MEATLRVEIVSHRYCLDVIASFPVNVISTNNGSQSSALHAANLASHLATGSYHSLAQALPGDRCTDLPNDNIADNEPPLNTDLIGRIGSSKKPDPGHWKEKKHGSCDFGQETKKTNKRSSTSTSPAPNRRHDNG